MNVVVCSETMSWFGHHTGYAVLTRYLREHLSVVEVMPREGLLYRGLGKAIALSKGFPKRPQNMVFKEWEFFRETKRRPGCIAHVLYVDGHLPFLDRWQPLPPRFCGSLHLPFSKWTPEALAGLHHLQMGFLLSRRELDQFQAYLPPGRLHFIPHGVDTDFFIPRPGPARPSRQLLYSGIYLRNVAMIERVIQRLHGKYPDLVFNLLVPVHARNQESLRRLAACPAVRWHAGLDDRELLALYQVNDLMLLPMNNSAANTAVVEALASGLPLVTTDVGGIRDYGGGTVFPIVDNNDDEKMIALVEKYLAEPGWRDEMARQGRRFAEENLAWPLVARKHIELYRELPA